LIDEEREYLDRYLKEWVQLEKTIQGLSVRQETHSKGVFYFYWVGRKL
jgi:hypothetical protein